MIGAMGGWWRAVSEPAQGLRACDSSAPAIARARVSTCQSQRRGFVPATGAPSLPSPAAGATCQSQRRGFVPATWPAVRAVLGTGGAGVRASAGASCLRRHAPTQHRVPTACVRASAAAWLLRRREGAGAAATQRVRASAAAWLLRPAVAERVRPSAAGSLLRHVFTEGGIWTRRQSPAQRVRCCDPTRRVASCMASSRIRASAAAASLRPRRMSSQDQAVQEGSERAQPLHRCDPLGAIAQLRLKIDQQRERRPFVPCDSAGCHGE